jgi:hypothetical protein
MADTPSLSRRALLAGLGAGAGLLVARGLGVSGLGAIVSPDPRALSFDALLRAFAASLTPRQRERVVLPADHPARQVVNTLAVLERPHLGTLLSPGQRALAGALYESMLSPRGLAAFAGTVAVEGRLDGCVLTIYGEPESGRAQLVLMGGHLMLRGGDDGGLGSGLAYGHQIGNGLWRVPGNSFAHHGDAANALFAALSPAERAAALQPAPPHELVLQPRGAGASFPGLRGGAASETAQAAFASLVDTVLASYPEADQARARACLADHGGLGALHFAVYESHGFYEDMARFRELDPAERARRGDPYWQVWRIEGPGAVIHFQGHPHVHAYVQIARDPGRANVGETLGVTSSGVEGEAMRRLLEGALRRGSGEPLAFYPEDVPGRICPGEITTGVAWAMSPYRNRVTVATISGAAMSAALRDRLARGGLRVEPGARYRVATTDYHATVRDVFGEPERVEPGETLLRDALVAHLRAGGLADAQG